MTFPSNVSLEKDKFIKTNKSFISSKFARKEVDILYRYNNKPIYFLVEHQSSVDESMPYRLLNYYMEIINDSVDNESLHSKKYSLSTVVPIVLYTGNKKWNVTQELKNKMVLVDGLEEYCLNMKYILVDVNQYTNEELLDINTCLAYGILIERCKGKEELCHMLDKISQVCENKISMAQMQAIINYILKPILKDDVEEELKKFDLKEVKKSMKTIQDYLVEEIQIERKEGFHEALTNIASEMLRLGEPIEKIMQYTKLSRKEIEALK